MITDTDKLRIVAFLKRFGCNRSESLVYIETLESGTTAVQELSRRLKQNRISVYYSVQQLIEKGFLFEIRKGKRRFIAAESPDVLMRIVKRRHTELDALEMDVAYIAGLLNAIPSAKHEKTVVKLYEETEGFKRMLEESLLTKNEILIFSNTPAFSKLIGEDHYEKYFARKAELGIPSRVIHAPCAFAERITSKMKQYRIDLRILKEEQVSDSGFYLWDDTVSIQSLKENKRSCTMIENKDIADFFRNDIFNHFWQEAKPVNVL